MNWIDQFMQHTQGVVSPPIFRKWAAISAVGAALERKVWARINSSNLYPNMFILLVAPPGVGKSQVVTRASDLVSSLPNHHVAPSSVTSAAMIDELNTATRTLIRPGEVPSSILFNSLYIASSELGTLLPGSTYDAEFMATLTDLWDCGTYRQRRRTKDLNIEIKKPVLNMLAACQPSYLRNTFPEGAWDQGFTSRTVMIYSGAQPIISLFTEEKEQDENEYRQLKTGLSEISKLYGKFVFTKEAAIALDNWHTGGRSPVPDAPKLTYYNVRRHMHLIKLCMVASSATRADLRIELTDLELAFDWLLEAELEMPEIFKAMSTSSHSNLIESAWYFVHRAYNKDSNQPVLAQRLIQFVSNNTPAHNVEKIIEIMVKAKVLQKTIRNVGGKAYDAYIPLVKET